jgi:uncharacterized protein
MSNLGQPFPSDMVEDNIDQPFWDACTRHELILYRCRICDRRFWPAGGCNLHGMADMDWVPASGRGRLHTWTVIHQTYALSFTSGPAVIAVVRLDEGPLIHSRLVECAEDQLVTDMPLEVTYEEVAEGVVLPLFRPNGEQ